MRFSYRNEYSDYLKHYELLHGSAFKELQSAYYSSLLLPVGFGVLGFAGTFPHSPVVSFLIIAGLVWYLIQAVPYKKHYDRAMETAMQALPDKDISLEVKAEGLVETVDGIESFCPWNSIEHYQMFKDVLFLSLKSNLWAIIPSSFLTEPGASMPELLGTLRSHSIKQTS